MVAAIQPDMTYRFAWDTEPTDEQLAALMREVGEETRRKNAVLEQKLRDGLHTELLRSRTQHETAAGHGTA